MPQRKKLMTGVLGRDRDEGLQVYRRERMKWQEIILIRPTEIKSQERILSWSVIFGINQLPA